MNTLLAILISTVLVSAIAFIGIVALALKEKLLKKLLLVLVALSAGTLLGSAFLHLIPEAVAKFDSPLIFPLVLVGFVFFFLVEKILHWRHCHKENCEIHPFAYMNLLGDTVHNFIDGLIIATAFVASTPLGITTTLAVILHEIPQEIGDFGVLIHGGFGRVKALLFNFMTAIAAIIGGIVGYLLTGYLENSAIFLLPFAAGGFIYISASDLLPELRKNAAPKESAITFVVFILGILVMQAVKMLTHSYLG